MISTPSRPTSNTKIDIQLSINSTIDWLHTLLTQLVCRMFNELSILFKQI